MTWGVTTSKPDQKDHLNSVSGAVEAPGMRKAETEPKTLYASTRAYTCAGMMLICGLLTIIAGICQEFAMYRIFHSFHGFSIWTGVLFTIAGTCAALACSKQSKPRLISATVFNVLTIIAAVLIILGFIFCVAKGIKYHRAMERNKKMHGDGGYDKGKMGWNKDHSDDIDEDDLSEDSMEDWDKRHHGKPPHHKPHWRCRTSHRPRPRPTGRPETPRPRASWAGTFRPRTSRPNRVRPGMRPQPTSPSPRSSGTSRPEKTPWEKKKNDWGKDWMKRKDWMKKYNDKRMGKKDDGSKHKKGDWMARKADMMAKFHDRWEMKMMCVSGIVIIIMVVMELVNACILTRYGVRSLRAAKYVMMSEPEVMTVPAAVPTDPEKKILAEMEDLPKV